FFVIGRKPSHTLATVPPNSFIIMSTISVCYRLQCLSSRSGITRGFAKANFDTAKSVLKIGAAFVNILQQGVRSVVQMPYLPSDSAQFRRSREPRGVGVCVHNLNAVDQMRDLAAEPVFQPG